MIFTKDMVRILRVRSLHFLIMITIGNRWGQQINAISIKKPKWKLYEFWIQIHQVEHPQVENETGGQTDRLIAVYAILEPVDTLASALLVTVNLNNISKGNNLSIIWSRWLKNVPCKPSICDQYIFRYNIFPYSCDTIAANCARSWNKINNIM